MYIPPVILNFTLDIDLDICMVILQTLFPAFKYNRLIDSDPYDIATVFLVCG